MGYLRDILNRPDRQAFPGAQFEATGEIPLSQCSEAAIESIIGQIFLGAPVIIENGKFVGWNLVGKRVTVTLPLVDAGTYNITANTDNQLVTDHFFNVNDNATEYYVHNGGSLILTRDADSIMQFAIDAGYAATAKGNKIYTDMPSAELQNACTILFDPLT